MVTPEPLLTLDNLTVRYRQHPALHHISGTLARGSLTAVIGPNGAGKSTLLKTLVGLLPQHGERQSLRLNTPRQRIAYLPQLSEIDRGFPISVSDCVLAGCWHASGVLGAVTPAQREQAARALHTLGLNGFEQRSVGSLSAGQLQRVLFARVLVQDAELILLDEPFNAIDSRTTTNLLTLVRHWHRQGRTVVAVLHDDEQVRQHFPDTLLLARELVAWGPTKQVLTAANLRRARAMAEAWDEAADWCDIDSLATHKLAHHEHLHDHDHDHYHRHEQAHSHGHAPVQGAVP